MESKSVTQMDDEFRTIINDWLVHMLPDDKIVIRRKRDGSLHAKRRDQAKLMGKLMRRLEKMGIAAVEEPAPGDDASSAKLGGFLKGSIRRLRDRNIDIDRPSRR